MNVVICKILLLEVVFNLIQDQELLQGFYKWEILWKVFIEIKIT